MPGWGNSTRRARLPRGWSNRIAPGILARDNRICYLCGQPGADTVDHIIPGDDHREENLGAVHDRNPPHCHRRKTIAERPRPHQSRLARERRTPEPHPGTVADG